MGLTKQEIVEALKPKEGIKISYGTVHNDLESKNYEIQANFNNYIEHEIPMQHRLAVTGLDKVLKEAWRLYLKAEDQKTALAALNVISDAILKKQSVLGDPTQIQKALMAVASLKRKLPEATR